MEANDSAEEVNNLSSVCSDLSIVQYGNKSTLPFDHAHAKYNKYPSAWADQRVLKKILPGIIKNITQWFWCQTISLHQSLLYFSNAFRLPLLHEQNSDV